MHIYQNPNADTKTEQCVQNARLLLYMIDWVIVIALLVDKPVAVMWSESVGFEAGGAAKLILFSHFKLK